MCIGCENPDMNIVSNYANKIFQGNSINEIARKEGISREEILGKIGVLKEMNPEAYQQICQAIGEDTKMAGSV